MKLKQKRRIQVLCFFDFLFVKSFNKPLTSGAFRDIISVTLANKESAMKYIQGLSRQRLQTLLEKMKTVKAVLIGDMCLDVYWVGDMTKSRLSRETPHFPLPIVEERFSAGAGGNAAVNMATLCDNFTPIGIIGNDWRGICLRSALSERGISDRGLVVENGHMTNAYCKPMRKGYSGIEVEDPRLDFESFSPISETLEERLIENLKKYASTADVLCVSDQFENGCVTDRVREVVNELARNGLLTVVDSRTRIDRFRHCVLKPNEMECSNALGLSVSACATEAEISSAACELAAKTESDVCLTLGEKGCLIVRGDNQTRVGAIPVAPPVDTVGAGDCFLSAFSLALAAGAEDCEAGVIGALASAVCVKKLNTTGSADAAELLALFDQKGATV